MGPKKFCFTTLYGDFILVFWFYVFDHSLWLFSSHGFHILYRLSSISFLVLFLFLSFLFILFYTFYLLVLVFYYFVSLYRLTFFLLPPHDFQWIKYFEGERVKVQIGHLRSVLKSMSSWNICWTIWLNALNEYLNIVNNILSGMVELWYIKLCFRQYTYVTIVGSWRVFYMGSICTH